MAKANEVTTIVSITSHMGKLRAVTTTGDLYTRERVPGDHSAHVWVREPAYQVVEREVYDAKAKTFKAKPFADDDE